MTATEEDVAAAAGSGMTQADIELWNKCFCIPMTLILNFGFFQFLVFVFYKRRNESVVRLLLGIAFMSVASLVPGAHPNAHVVRDLNDISEVSTVLSFVLQITILTRDVNKKVKLPTVIKLARTAEILVLLGLSVLTTNFIDLVAPVIDMDTVELMDRIVEYVSLAFIVGFRFYFLAMARGAAKVWKTQKLEIFFYVLLATHTTPFYAITAATGLDWHHVQGLWMRCTIVLCLSSTIRARMASTRSGGVGTSSVGGPSSAKESKPQGPSSKNVYTTAKNTSICPAPSVK